MEELALLKGVTPELLIKLRPCVTVYGTDQVDLATKVNVNTAPKEVLAALDEKLRDDLVDRILEYRKTKPIKGPGDINSIPGLDTVWPNVVDKLTFSGNVYRVRAEGRVGESVSTAEAVVRIAGGIGARPEVLYWREY